MLKELASRHTFLVFLLLIIVMIPIALYEPSAFDRYAIVTVLGLDKDDSGNIEATALVLTPQTSGQFSQNIRLFSTSGENVSQCMFRMGVNLGKKIGLAHCEAIVLGETILQEDITKYLDYFVRNKNLSINSVLINCPTKASELLETLSSIQESDDVSIQNVISHNKNILFTANINIENFYANYESANSAYFMPIISVEDKQSSSSQSEDSGSSQGGESSSSSSSKESGGGEKTINVQGQTAIIKDGKKVREMSVDEIYAYNLLSPKTKQGILLIEDLEDPSVKGDSMVLDFKHKNVSYSAKFVDDKPVFMISCDCIVGLNELISDNYTYSDFEAVDSHISQTTKKQIKQKFQEYATLIVNGMREDNVDTLDVYAYFDAYEHNKWQDFLKSNGDDDYLSKVIFTFDMTIKDAL